MKRVDPPFELGETLKGTDSNSNLLNPEWLGQVFEHQVLEKTVSRIRGNLGRLTGRSVLAIALRNESGAALQPKSLVQLTRTAGYSLTESVDGYPAVHAEKLCVFVDGYLGSDTVADDDIFWGIISGPTLAKTSTVGANFNGDIAVAGLLVAGTGSTTGSTSEGRVANFTLPGQTGATAALNAAANIVAAALSARTTGETDSDILVNACVRNIV